MNETTASQKRTCTRFFRERVVRDVSRVADSTASSPPILLIGQLRQGCLRSEIAEMLCRLATRMSKFSAEMRIE